MWSEARSWMRSLWRRESVESEMDAELRDHIERRADDLMRESLSRNAAGEVLTREDALRMARLEFGAVDKAKEECREARGVGRLETIGQDLRFGARMLRKNPGFTLVAVLTLALGIGANSAIFSLVDGILLRPLSFPQPERLVDVTGTYPKGAFAAMRERVQSADLAAYAEGHEFNLTGQGEAQRLTGTLVSANFFSVLGTNSQIGRTFYSGEDRVGQDNFVVLSDALWRERFGGDASIVGRPISLEGVSRVVVGVMPADFRFPSAKTQVWIPLHNDPSDVASYWAGDFMQVIGRLRPGASESQARTEVKMFQTHAGELFPWPMPSTWNANVSVLPLRSGFVSDVRGRLTLLLGAVGLILLIACVNVANLSLSRAAVREKEIAVRTAMGAGRGRLVRQLLTESVLLASIGGALGVLLATGGLQILKSALPADTPRLAEAHIDWRVMAFTAGLAILTGFLFGLAPAIHSSRVAIAESMGSGSRGAGKTISQELRGALATAEVALSVLLVIAAGLLIRSFWIASHADPGFRVATILTARITPNEDFCNDAARCVSFYGELLRRVEEQPGVNAAAIINTLPQDGRVAKRSIEIEARPTATGAPQPLVWLNTVTPDYFRVMNIPMSAGRGFQSADQTGAPTAILTASTAKKLFPAGDAVGSHFRFSNEQEWRTVVGVVADVKGYDFARIAPDWMDGVMYVPYSVKATTESARVPADMTLAVDSKLSEQEMQSAVRRIVGELNPEIPAGDMKSMTAVVAESVATPASTTWLFASFAAVAVVLGVIGIYGVLSFLVSRRTREIGIRMALGAQRRDVLWMVMREGLKYSVAGIGAGLVFALIATRLLASELYGVSPLDPATFAAAALVMGAATLSACYVPTRRAMKVDPLVALRNE